MYLYILQLRHIFGRLKESGMYVKIEKRVKGLSEVLAALLVTLRLLGSSYQK